MDGFKLHGVTFVDTSKFFEYGTVLSSRKIPRFVVNYDKYLLIGGKKNAVFELENFKLDNEIPNNYRQLSNFESLTDIIFIYADNKYLYFLQFSGSYMDLIIYDVYTDTYQRKQTPIPSVVSDKVLRYVKPLKLFDDKILLNCMYNYSDNVQGEAKQHLRMFVFNTEYGIISNIVSNDEYFIQYMFSNSVTDQIVSFDVINFSGFSLIYFFAYLNPFAIVFVMLYDGSVIKLFKDPSNTNKYFYLSSIIDSSRTFSNNLVNTSALFYTSSHYSCNSCFPINYTQTSSGDIIEILAHNIYNTRNIRKQQNSSEYVTGLILNTFKFKLNISKLEFYELDNVQNTITQTINFSDLYAHYQPTGDTTYTYYEPTAQSMINNGSTSLYLGFEFGNDYIFKGTDLIEFPNYLTKTNIQLNKGSSLYYHAYDELPQILKDYLNKNYVSDLFTENNITASDGTTMKGNMWYNYLFPSCNMLHYSKLNHDVIYTKIKTVRTSQNISLFPSSPITGYVANRELKFQSPIKTFNQINRISVMPAYIFEFLQNSGHINRLPVIIYEKSYII